VTRAALAALGALALAACTDWSAPPGAAGTTHEGDGGDPGTTSNGGHGGLAAHGGGGGEGGTGGAPAPPSILLFTKTLGYRHPSIDVAVPALTAIGAERGWVVSHTEDASAFDAAQLSALDAVVFLLTTGEVLDAAQQLAFVDFIHQGGGFAGVHSASDTHHNWPWYGALVGAYFEAHWSVIAARVLVEDATHPATAHLGAEWLRSDEWYTFDHNPRPEVSVLLALDEAHYAQSGAPPEYLMGGDHPLAWHHTFERGRAFYTALGHSDESYAEPALRAHLAGGIEWAAGAR
jgi:type 1 glutamine amidotransferase